MIRYRQNRIAESRLSLPVAVVYGGLVWLAAGTVAHAWWWQFCCFAISVYLMIELNNRNALIRIYSRMVSCSFIFLTCLNSLLFPSTSGTVLQLATVAFFVLSFPCYQDRQAAGHTFYAFMVIGIASLFQVQILYVVPFCWLLMMVSFYSFSLRTFFASLLGLLTPYWIVSAYFLYYQDFSTPVRHFLPLLEDPFTFDYHLLTLPAILTYITLTVLGITGIIHFLRSSYLDSVRIRMLYKGFIYPELLLIIIIPMMPQHAEWLLRMMIVCTTPLIAHFIALTHSRLSNIAFHLMVAVVIALTCFHLFLS